MQHITRPSKAPPTRPPPPPPQIIEGDAAAADVSSATVVALYLSDSGNAALLRAVGGTLRRGTRVVSLYFPVAGWEGCLQRHDTSAGIDIYLYSAP